MAEWKDVIHQIVRICKLQKGACGTCVLNAESCPNSVRFDLSDEAGFVNIEKAIMTWAAANPEPVYPTWREWLIKKGLIDFKADFKSLSYNPSLLLQENPVIECLNEKASEPIPADIAESLGLEPKEGT